MHPQGTTDLQLLRKRWSGVAQHVWTTFHVRLLDRTRQDSGAFQRANQRSARGGHGSLRVVHERVRKLGAGNLERERSVAKNRIGAAAAVQVPAMPMGAR